MRKQYSVPFIAGIALMFVATQTHGQSFSVTAGGPTPAPGDDILNPGPVPVLVGSVAIPLAPALEVDAFSWGYHTDFNITDYQFSVDPGSVGAAATAVATEAGGGAGGPGDHPADIYNSKGAGGNTLLWDGDGVANPGIAPSLTLVEPAGDNVDGWDNRLGPAPAIFYSLDLATAPAAGIVGADVMLAPSIPGYDVPPAPLFYAAAGVLGLDTLGVGSDDIDALVVFDHSGAAGTFDAADYILFSLTAGSASLVGGSGTAYAGSGGEDILIATAGGAAGLFTPGAALGLAAGDELDALDVIPEPSTVLLLGLGAAGLYIRKILFI